MAFPNLIETLPDGKVRTEHRLFGIPPLANEHGIVNIGIPLLPDTVLCGYSVGVFPWYSSRPSIWFAPPMRSVFEISSWKPSRSLRRDCSRLVRDGYRPVTGDHLLEAMTICAADRDGGTWINPDMLAAYPSIEKLGLSRSILIEDPSGKRVAAIYGFQYGRVFFAESMGGSVPGASKMAFACAMSCAKLEDLAFIDSQVINPHTELLGAREITKLRFESYLSPASGIWTPGNWSEHVELCATSNDPLHPFRR